MSSEFYRERKIEAEREREGKFIVKMSSTDLIFILYEKLMHRIWGKSVHI